MFNVNSNRYIRGIKIKAPNELVDKYPFSLKAIKGFKELELESNVSFIVGENGTGKSTLLEAIAITYGFNPEGGTKNFNFSTCNTHSILADYMTLIKGVLRPKDGFFLRAESFYNVASNIDELDRSGGPSRVVDSYGGVSLHNMSHGESFMSLVLNRFTGQGIYFR